MVQPVVEPGGACALVSRHGLRDLELAAVRQVLRDAGRTEWVIPDSCPDPCRAGSPHDDAIGVRLAHRLGEVDMVNNIHYSAGR